MGYWDLLWLGAGSDAGTEATSRQALGRAMAETQGLGGARTQTWPGARAGDRPSRAGTRPRPRGKQGARSQE